MNEEENKLLKEILKRLEVLENKIDNPWRTTPQVIPYYPQPYIPQYPYYYPVVWCVTTGTTKDITKYE